MRLRHLLSLIAVAACLLAAPLRGHAQAMPEASVKSAYLYNFALFSEWPDEQPGAGVVACAFATSGTAGALVDLQNKPIKGGRLQFRTLAQHDSVRGCQLLFIDGIPRERWKQLRTEMGANPVLTVADNTDAQYEGAVITLVRTSDKIAFNIDAAAARNARIVLSSKLLRLARNLQ
ncbi:MAG TPA: YfiR family protein [Burkholderiaceae bacterium]